MKLGRSERRGKARCVVGEIRLNAERASHPVTQKNEKLHTRGKIGKLRRAAGDEKASTKGMVNETGNYRCMVIKSTSKEGAYCGSILRMCVCTP